MIRATLLYSAAILSTVSYYTSNHRSYFSLSNEINYVGVTSVFMNVLILNLFFHFYFLDMDISLNIYTLVIQFYTGVLNIPLQETVYFMTKNG